MAIEFDRAQVARVMGRYRELDGGLEASRQVLREFTGSDVPTNVPTADVPSEIVPIICERCLRPAEQGRKVCSACRKMAYRGRSR